MILIFLILPYGPNRPTDISIIGFGQCEVIRGCQQDLQEAGIDHWTLYSESKLSKNRPSVQSHNLYLFLLINSM
jgi:hypothetical protein